MPARHPTYGTAASVVPPRLRSLPLLLLLTATSSASPDAWAEALRGSSDPAIKWFANERDIPCAPGWGGFLCNEKLLPLGEVPLPLPATCCGAQSRFESVERGSAMHRVSRP